MTRRSGTADRLDVSLFDRFARLYDVAMRPGDADALAAGLAYADGPIEVVLDVGGGTGRASRVVEEAVRRSDAVYARTASESRGESRDRPAAPGRNGSGEQDGTADPRPVVLDAARGMLREARTTGLDAVQADAGSLPVRDWSADAVVIVDALHHLPAAERAVAEASRVLRPGGVLVVREFDPTTLRGRLLAAAERAVGFDSTFRRPEAVVGLVERVGLAPFVPDRGFGYTVVGAKRGD